MARELDQATRHALDLYSELVGVGQSVAASRESQPQSCLLGQSSFSTQQGPIEEVLGSFRQSFSQLSTALNSVAKETEVGRALRPSP